MWVKRSSVWGPWGMMLEPDDGVGPFGFVLDEANASLDDMPDDEFTGDQVGDQLRALVHVFVGVGDVDPSWSVMPSMSPDHQLRTSLIAAKTCSGSSFDRERD